jgi:hypothetical protein
MKTRTIEVIVSPIGEVQIDAMGFKGADCAHATKFLEEALGTIQQKQRRPEYHQRSTVKNQQRIGN